MGNAHWSGARWAFCCRSRFRQLYAQRRLHQCRSINWGGQRRLLYFVIWIYGWACEKAVEICLSCGISSSLKRCTAAGTTCDCLSYFNSDEAVLYGVLNAVQCWHNANSHLSNHVWKKTNNQFRFRVYWAITKGVFGYGRWVVDVCCNGLQNPQISMFLSCLSPRAM